MIFQGIRTSFAKKLYIFVIFRVGGGGGGSRPSVPTSGSAPDGPVIKLQVQNVGLDQWPNSVSNVL